MAVIAKERAANPLGVSAEEWQLRVDLAACYQLVELYGMWDMPGNHISVRVPGPEHHFLLNPRGLFFEEITASSLIKVDLNGKVIANGTDDDLSPAAFTIHSAIHMARQDLVCVLHTHTRAVNGVGMQEDGLLPIHQKAIVIWDYLAYHDYEGTAIDALDERERIQRDLPEKARCMILRGHGALTVGRSVAEAFSWMIKLEMACQYQIDGLAGNRKLTTYPEEMVQRIALKGRKNYDSGRFASGWEWPALLRKLERERGTAYKT